MECWSPSTLWEKRKKSRRRTSTPQAAQFSNGRRDGPARPVPPRSGDAVPSTDAPSVGCEAGNSEPVRSEEHTSELQSLMRISYAVFCLKKKTKNKKMATRTYN